MKILLFFAAAALLTLGHWFKTLRWQQFVSVYEDSRRRNLVNALAAGYLVNFCLPLHLGDLLRTWLAGRTMKNGTGLALATVFWDRVLDIITIGMIFVGLAQIHPTDDLQKTALFYGVLMLALFLIAGFVLVFRAPIKRLIGKFCALFNPSVERHLMLLFWALISACKDMHHRINKGNLVLNTFLMWSCYFFSYALLAKLLSQPFLEIFLTLFGNIAHSSLLSFFAGGVDFAAIIIFALYLLLPVVSLFILTSVRFTIFSHQASHPVALIPQTEAKEQLQFLRSYYDGQIREYLQDYIAMNRDITILRDLSAGSAATTMLCLRDKSLFYRKYAFGSDGKKLQEQAQWIHRHSDTLPLPQILDEITRPASYCYDMAYRSGNVNFFEYVHSHSAEESWQLLEKSLHTLQEALYQNPIPADREAIDRYITEKVHARLQDIMDAGELKPLTRGDTIQINGAVYRNLPTLMYVFEKSFLTQVFSGDSVTDIHGDLTIENMVADPNMPNGFYFIDPNTGNILESPCLDYGKLLQSLHGKYEFLRMVSESNVSAGKIDFLFSYTENYAKIYSRYDRWLSENFDAATMRSIYCHELVHWLRLMPYKIKQLGKNAAVYYAAFILVLNDVADRLENSP